jgi:hypothetical protein
LEKKRTIYGGVSGYATRPFFLKFNPEIHQKFETGIIDQSVYRFFKFKGEASTAIIYCDPFHSFEIYKKTSILFLCHNLPFYKMKRF